MGVTLSDPHRTPVLHGIQDEMPDFRAERLSPTSLQESSGFTAAPVALNWMLGFRALKPVLADPGNFCSPSSKGVPSRVPGEGILSKTRGADSGSAQRLC